MTTEKQLTEITVQPSETEKEIMNAIALLEPIPEEKWCIDSRGNNEGQHCFLGHLDAHDNDFELSSSMSYLFHSILGVGGHIFNNGSNSHQIADDSCYRQMYDRAVSNFPGIMSLQTPKQRTLAGLKLLLQKELEK